MELNKIVIHIGDFGRYQKLLYSLICVSAVFAGIFSVISVMLLAIPDHRCKIPGYVNDTYAIQSNRHRELIGKYIPPSSDETREYHRCHLYNRTNVQCGQHCHQNATELKCSEWVYSHEVFRETFTSIHNLVCDESYKVPLAQSMYFAGVFAGALLFGNLSDAFGRKKAFYIAVLVFLISSFGLAWSPSYVFFSVCMVILGVSTEGVYSVGFVLGMELVGPSKRRYTGMIVDYFFALGLVILSGVGYAVRHWQYIEIICAIPVGLLIPYWWILPESARWLVSKRRYAEAKRIILKAAQFNKVRVDDDVFDDMSVSQVRRDGRIWQLFTSRVLLLRTSVICLNWMVVSMIYYGLSLNSGYLGGNYYLNFCLSGLVEFPAFTLPLLLLDRVGRKCLHCLCMILGGTACISTIFSILYLDEKYLPVTIALAMLGKFGAAGAFGIIFMYSAELYPTVVRNAGMGASSCAGRIGSVAAPYIADWGEHISGKGGKAFPLAVFGVLSITAGLLSLCLPETLGQELPETIEDAIMFGTPAYQKKIADHPERVTCVADHPNVICCTRL